MRKGTRILCASFVLLALCLAVPVGVVGQMCYLNCPLGDGNSPGMIPMNKSPDLNGDSQVNLIDLALFAQSWPPGPYNYCADYDCDGIIGLVDFALFAAHWTHQGPTPGYCI